MQSVTADQTLQALLVADDVLGGFFALNGGEFGEDRGGVYYLSPDSLKWESLDINYSGFLLGFSVAIWIDYIKAYVGKAHLK